MALKVDVNLDDIDAYAIGFVDISVCVPSWLKGEDLIEAVNLVYPTGIQIRWTLDDQTHFPGGEVHPNPCSRKEGKLHYHFTC